MTTLSKKNNPSHEWNKSSRPMSAKKNTETILSATEVKTVRILNVTVQAKRKCEFFTSFLKVNAVHKTITFNNINLQLFVNLSIGNTSKMNMI